MIDLNTDKVIRRFEIPETLVDVGHGMISLAIDVEKDKCDEAFAYIPDYLKQKIYVYRYVLAARSGLAGGQKELILYNLSFKENRIWAFSHVYLKNEKKFGYYDIDGHKFEWFDGVCSVALGRRSSNGYRRAFFHPLAR